MVGGHRPQPAPAAAGKPGPPEKGTKGGVPLKQARVNVAVSPARRGVAGNVDELTFRLTPGADFRGNGRRDEQAAAAALPVIKVGTDIPDKFPGSRKSTLGRA